MRKLLASVAVAIMLTGCGNGKQDNKDDGNKQALSKLLDTYWEERLQLYPVEATSIGDNRYNDRLTITIATSFRDTLQRFYDKYLQAAQQIDTNGLSAEEQLNYNIFCYEMRMNLEDLKYPKHLIPITQFWSFTLELPQMGSGTGNQPFKDVADYDAWLKRLSRFEAWTDTAIANMRQGIAQGWVLPKSLVVKILPQLKDVASGRDTASIFYGPIRNLPANIGTADRKRLDSAYRTAIAKVVVPCYEKLHQFFEQTYMPAARASSGINDMPGGKDYYQYCIKYWTTTDLNPDSIYNIGIAEVARIEAEMNKVKEQVGFKGTLQAFFKHMSEDKQLFPFVEAQQVIDSFWNIKKAEDPKLKELFNKTPTTQFTIRQTESFRAASASAEYNQGSEDGTRPGIFYVPVVDAKKFNCAGMTTLFLHEAIPGHHYQISLQQENKNLPSFRRFLWYGAYGEGWAHYAETLGKDLGLYGDPYQYFGHLSDAIHRAIRLVVDVGLHQKGMSREEAIKYMTEHELVSEAEATAEIERYMALPGQALSYKIGQIAISGERKKYEEMLGKRFDIGAFHDEVLRNGCVPLQVMRSNMSMWAKTMK